MTVVGIWVVAVVVEGVLAAAVVEVVVAFFAVVVVAFFAVVVVVVSTTESRVTTTVVSGVGVTILVTSGAARFSPATVTAATATPVDVLAQEDDNIRNSDTPVAPPTTDAGVRRTHERSSARTLAGSNLVPELFAMAATASDELRPEPPKSGDVRLTYASATANKRASLAIAWRERPFGYPEPSQCS